MTKGIFIPIGNDDELAALRDTLTEVDVPFTEINAEKGNIKPLPVQANGKLSPVFIANGKTYTIISPDQGIGIERWTWLTTFLIPFWYGHRDFASIHKYWEDSIGEVFKTTTLRDAQILHLNKAKAFMDSLVDIDEQRYDVAMYICSLFIVCEGEDLRYFTKTDADRKIEDWKIEGYNAKDFFLIASYLQTEFRAEYEARIAALEKTKKELIGLTAMSLKEEKAAVQQQ